MKERPDVVDEAIATLKKIAARHGHAPNWSKIERDLESFFVQLYYRAGLPEASITEARQLLGETSDAISAAKSMPKLMLKFAARTYGDEILPSIPWEAMKTYSDALAVLESCVDTLEKMFMETLSRAGKTKGMKGPLLDRVVGTPIEHFLRCLIGLWREATGSKVLGKRFEDVAKEMIEAAFTDDHAGDRREIGDLKRQIENAKRRGEIVD
jgi:hypothetical protein